MSEQVNLFPELSPLLCNTEAEAAEKNENDGWIKKAREREKEKRKSSSPATATATATNINPLR
jgi:hypothetical protein